MADYIEGKRPIIEALRTQVPIKRILLADNAKRDGLVEDILRKAKHFDVDVTTVPRKTLDDKSERGSHQGVMAETKPHAYVDITVIERAAEAYAEENGGRALVVILDHLTDAGNLGAIARSAEAVGACGLVIPNKRSAKVDASTSELRAGAMAHLPSHGSEPRPGDGASNSSLWGGGGRGRQTRRRDLALEPGGARSPASWATRRACHVGERRELEHVELPRMGRGTPGHRGQGGQG